MTAESNGAIVPEDVLTQVPLLTHLKPSELRQLAAAGEVMLYQPGETVLEQGKSSQNLWFVLSGRCEVVKKLDEGRLSGELVVLTTLEPYNHFGEMSFFQAAPHSASVIAVTELKLLRIGRSTFDGMLEQECLSAYKLAHNAVISLADRLRRMDNWVAELVAEDQTAERVAEWKHFRDRMFKNWSI